MCSRGLILILTYKNMTPTAVWVIYWRTGFSSDWSLLYVNITLSDSLWWCDFLRWYRLVLKPEILELDLVV